MRTLLKSLALFALSAVFLVGCGKNTEHETTFSVEIEQEVPPLDVVDTSKDDIEENAVDMDNFIKNVGLANSVVTVWDNQKSVLVYKRNDGEDKISDIFFSTKNCAGYYRPSEIYIVADGKFYWKSNDSYIVGTYFNANDYAEDFSQYASVFLHLSPDIIESVEKTESGWICDVLYDMDDGTIAKCKAHYSESYALEKTEVEYQSKEGESCGGETCFYKYGEDLPSAVVKFYEEMTNAEQTRDVTYHIIEDNEETETLTANGPEGTYVCGVFSSLQGEDYALYSNPELTEAYDYSFPTGDKDVYVVF